MTENCGSPKVVGVVCARMSSSRLPGKVLMPVMGKPALERLLERLARARAVHTIVVATSDRSEDAPVADLALSLGHQAYLGSLDDVLGRVFGAAAFARADVVVDVTGDMILLDHGVIDHGVNLLVSGGYDYVTNVAYDPDSGRTLRSYPMGVNAVVFTMDALRRMVGEADDPSCREHVSLYADLHPHRFRSHFFHAPQDLARAEWRFALDYREDYEFICKIYECIAEARPMFTYEDALALLRERPELLDVNRRPTPVGRR